MASIGPGEKRRKTDATGAALASIRDMIPKLSAKRLLAPRPTVALASRRCDKAAFARALARPTSSPAPDGNEKRPAEGLASRSTAEHAADSDAALLDPAARSALLLAPPVPPGTPKPASPTLDSVPASAQRAAEAHALATALVERAAFWGDGTRGLARLRFGHGARLGLSGATVVLEHDGEHLALRIEDVDDEAATEKLVERLRAKGLTVNE
jgi:hypothetical protein